MQNWSTFRKMKASADEVEEYILEMAKNAVTDTIRRYVGLLESDISKLEKDRWFEMHPAALVNFKQQGIVLLNFGIEEIWLDKILDARSDFQAYVFTPERHRDQHQSIFSSLDTLFLSLPAPTGFLLNINKPATGYYYTKRLAPLAADKLPDNQFLTEYFRAPLVSAIEWYKTYSKQILAVEPK